MKGVSRATMVGLLHVSWKASSSKEIQGRDGRNVECILPKFNAINLSRYKAMRLSIKSQSIAAFTTRSSESLITHLGLHLQEETLLAYSIESRTKMSSISSSLADIIPFTSRALHKFYEPLVLLEALNVAAKEAAGYPTTAESPVIKDIKELYHTFVYKLAHVCDNVKGGHHGGSITSIMILCNTSGIIQYYFASNNRTQEQLETTSNFIDDLLQQLKGLRRRSSNQGLLIDPVLQSVLLFNQPRITVYLKRLDFQARECLKNYSSLEPEESRSIAHAISDFLSSARPETPIPVEGPEFVTRCKVLIDQLITMRQSQVGILIEARAREGRMLGYRSQECWSEFQHTMSRILAYPQSVQFLRKARKNWPELFEDYEIHAIPSSSPIQRPCRNKSQTADGIVGRMTRKQKEIETFRSFVATLQSFNLDARIQNQWRNESFRPIVHSEIILLDWLENNGGIEPYRFFNGWMYIGSSKPTCRLCHYYFEAHGSGVEHRPSHENLYISWRFPDVFVSQGNQARDLRQVMMDRILVKIRKDAFQLVRQKVPPSYKEHDSNTFSAMITFRDSYMIDERSVVDMDDVTSLMGEVSLDRK
ncbi:hypothetical protein BKA67DRAFT_633727 [Truncatella angustata]|uniref:Uncharacterized protein n=1 Tax=Truncatella angustata TaxID=152316 RepID=A0A9P9A120_9PEZI|nr:uncharacterized protein BKA67DRAFT_633727 [Truncatella angustata]KAH6659056.1 hypothetical protein BKA67DRAFT_633727 [Truncatella angustata]